MADVIQAAKWMQEGIEVIRISPDEEGYRYRIDEDNFVQRWKRTTGGWTLCNVLTSGDLLANDWEKV